MALTQQELANIMGVAACCFSKQVAKSATKLSLGLIDSPCAKLLHFYCLIQLIGCYDIDSDCLTDEELYTFVNQIKFYCTCNCNE